jgi:autotransporter-associated beta strand protein
LQRKTVENSWQELPPEFRFNHCSPNYTHNINMNMNPHNSPNKSRLARNSFTLLKCISFICLAFVAASAVVQAGNLSWDQSGGGALGGTGTWDLNSSQNWWNGSADITWQDNSAAGTNSAIFAGTAGTVTLNTSLSASNLQFTTTGYTVSGSGALTLGAGGIDASALTSGTTTIGVPLSLSGGQQRWQIGSGGTLAVNGAVSRSAGAAVDFSTSGVTSSTLANVNGVIGGWATVGASANQNTTGDWAATNGSGGVVAYTGYTVGATITSGATVNWKNTATATVSGAVTINSLNQQADVNINSGATLTLGNGGLLMFAGPRWILNNNNGNTSGTGALTSGSATGELFLHVPYSGGANNWTVWPKVTDNGATAVKVVKDGSGSLFLPNANTFSGGLTVNGGIVSILSFGGGNMAVNGGQLRLGYLASGTAAPTYTGSVALNGGAFYEQDSFIHLSGTVTVGPAGGSLGGNL